MAVTGKIARVLLSAYSCQPHHGSEYAVGWNWALGVAKRGYETWVLTREANKDAIEQEVLAGTIPSNLHFLFYDLPHWPNRLKDGLGWVHLYYFLWQIFAYRYVRKIHTTEKFDLVQHVTFVSVRQPSFMGLLNIPFIFGPVGGGEKAPIFLRKEYGLKAYAWDFLRDMVNFFVKIDPFMRLTFSRAEKIYVTSEQSKNLIPKKYHPKTAIQLAIGTTLLAKTGKPSIKKKTGKRLIFIGRFLDLKGMATGLRAFAKALTRCPELTLTMVGRGPAEKHWQRLSKSLGIAGKVDWVPWVPQKQLANYYATHDILFFPSLHESGGMVVLEALANGLPVICLNLGGPGVIINNKCGRAISIEGHTAREVENTIAETVCALAQNATLLRQLSKGAVARAKDFEWKNVVQAVYKGK